MNLRQTVMKVGPFRLLFLAATLSAAVVVELSSVTDRRNTQRAEAIVLETVQRIEGLEAPASLGDVARVLREQAGPTDPLLLVYLPANGPIILPHRLNPEVFSSVRALLKLPAGTPMMVPGPARRSRVAAAGDSAGGGDPLEARPDSVARDTIPPQAGFPAIDAPIAWSGGSSDPAGHQFRIVHRDSVWLPAGDPGEIVAVARAASLVP